VVKIAIFGGTGRTGQHLIRQALSEDHQVSVLARDPGKLDEFEGARGGRLSLITGNLADSSCIEQAVSGADVVISVLGPTTNQPTYEVSQGVQHLIEAMKKFGVKRLILSTGAGVGDPEDAPNLFNRLMNTLLAIAARHVYQDMLKTVALVRSSDLDWTVVRVPMLIDGPKTGKVRVGRVGKGIGPRITRADLADFLLQQVTSRELVHKAPAISN
jgi:putative NADH-flavin reductase